MERSSPGLRTIGTENIIAESGDGVRAMTSMERKLLGTRLPDRNLACKYGLRFRCREMLLSSFFRPRMIIRDGFCTASRRCLHSMAACYASWPLMFFLSRPSFFKFFLNTFSLRPG